MAKIRRVQADAPITASPTEDGMLRILVCGSRDWEDVASIRLQLLKMISDFGFRTYDDVLVITGGQRGADQLTEELCLNELGIACARYAAPWKFWTDLGKGHVAGPTRNFWMLRWGQPHAILAFHPYLPESKGTKSMLNLARKHGMTRIRVVKGKAK